MKKIITTVVSSILIITLISISVFAVTRYISNDKIDEIINTTYDDGSDFMKANSSAPAFNQADALKAVDDDDSTFWTVSKDGDYTQLTFDKATSINNIEIKEIGENIYKYHIAAWNGEEWVKVYNNDMLGGYYCAVIDNIKTPAIRLYVDEIKEGAVAKIADLRAIYQFPIDYEDRDFISMSYVTSNLYFHEWLPGWSQEDCEKTYNSLTDVVMLGMFKINKDGEFIISRERYGYDNATVAVYPALSEAADKFLVSDDMSVIPAAGYENERTFPVGKKGAFTFMRDYIGESNSDLRIWISLTVLGKSYEEFGGVDPAKLSAFNDPDIRTKFVNDVVTFLKKYDLAGVDIDWEYPGTNEAWRAYEALIFELADALHENGLLFSTAQSAYGGIKLSKEALNKFDRINMMSYDYQKGSDRSHHSNYQNATIKDIQRYIKLGIQPEKLVLGLAYYSSQRQVGWSTICSQMEAYEVLDPGTNFFKDFTFNNVNLIKDRTMYAVKRKIGGVFSWHIGVDVAWSGDYSLQKAQQEVIDRFVDQD